MTCAKSVLSHAFPAAEDLHTVSVRIYIEGLYVLLTGAHQSFLQPFSVVPSLPLQEALVLCHLLLSELILHPRVHADDRNGINCT